VIDCSSTVLYYGCANCIRTYVLCLLLSLNPSEVISNSVGPQFDAQR